MADQGQINSDPKVAVVTGASSGIGKATAFQLARLGFTVIAMGRNPARSLDAVADIRRELPNARIWPVIADLASLAQTRRAAAEIAGITGRVDVLVNNAGAMIEKRLVTEDGLEATFAGNHLGPFLLTNLLLPQLCAAPAARIINVSSIGHTMIPDIAWDDLQMVQEYNAMRAYAQSKLANILFTRALSGRLASAGIMVNAMHPGMIASRFALSAGEQVRLAYHEAEAAGHTVSEDAGADTIIWLAAAPEAAVETGGYFVGRTRSETSAAAANDDSAGRLWEISSRLAFD